MSRYTRAARLASIGVDDSDRFARLGKRLLGGAQRPYVAYRRYDAATDDPAAWLVRRPGHRTNPDGNAAELGDKAFFVPWGGGREAKAKALAEAQAWAAARYHVAGEWARDPYGAWHPAEVVAAVAEHSLLRQRDAADEATRP